MFFFFLSPFSFKLRHFPNVKDRKKYDFLKGGGRIINYFFFPFSFLLHFPGNRNADG